jgi:hypothetical protein
MKRTVKAAALLVSAALVLVSLPADAAKLSAKQIKKLEQGWQVTTMMKNDGGYVGGTAHILMKEDIDRAWKEIQKPKVYTRLYPTVVEAKVLSTEGKDTLVKMVHGNKVLKATCYLNYRAEDDKHRLHWRLAKKKPNDIADTRGSIKLSRYKDGRTLMTMSTVLDIGNDFIEKMFGDRIVKGLLWLPYKFRQHLSRDD